MRIEFPAYAACVLRAEGIPLGTPVKTSAIMAYPLAGVSPETPPTAPVVIVRQSMTGAFYLSKS